MKKRDRQAAIMRGHAHAKNQSIAALRDENRDLRRRVRELEEVELSITRLDATPAEAPTVPDVIFAATDAVKEAFDLLCTAAGVPTYEELEEQAQTQQENASLGLDVEAMQHRLNNQAATIEMCMKRAAEQEEEILTLKQTIGNIRSALS